MSSNRVDKNVHSRECPEFCGAPEKPARSRR